MTMTANRLRLSTLAVLVAAATTVSACGGGSAPKAAPGTPDNPLQAQATPTAASKQGARTNEAATPSAPSGKAGYQQLLESQSSNPQKRFTPCNLVSRAQARAILGAPILDPIEADQGPTCVYRSKDGKSFVTLAVQTLDFKKAVKPHMKASHRVAVSDRTGYCGTFGQPMLYVPLSKGRVLSVAAHCTVAKQFAIKAVPHLPA
jgi:hypothetical protein